MPQHLCQAPPCRAAPGHHNLAVRSHSPMHCDMTSSLADAARARSSRDHFSAVHAIFVAVLKESNNSNTDVYLFWAGAACLSMITTEFTACAQPSVSCMEIGCVTAVDAALDPPSTFPCESIGPSPCVMHIFRSLRRRQPWLGYCCGCHPGSAAAGSHSSCIVPRQAQAAQEAGKPSCCTTDIVRSLPGSGIDPHRSQQDSVQACKEIIL